MKREKENKQTLSTAGKINSERSEILICKNENLGQRHQAPNNLHVNKVNYFKPCDQMRENWKTLFVEGTKSLGTNDLRWIHEYDTKI